MRLAVLGDPVSHSRSPAMQQAALEALGLPGRYRARRVDEAGLRQAVVEVRTGRLDGANVTMPHKELAARLVDRLVGPAEATGSVNTLVRAGELTVEGHNTDVDGVRWAFRRAGLPEEGPVLVLGAGGAAAAAVLAFGDRRPVLTARRRGRAAALLERLGVEGEVAAWGTPLEGAVVVNATPLGMAGEALPAGILEEASGLLDMAYGEEETPAVRAARKAGLPVADGLEMLLGQGMASFRLWTGREPPEEAMRAALRRAS